MLFVVQNTTPQVQGIATPETFMPFVLANIFYSFLKLSTMLQQTATPHQIRKAKKIAGKGKHSIVFYSLKELAKIARIYNR